jgi:ketosteroid isomerase-like protein
MASQRVEIVQRLYRAMEEWDLETVAELAHPEAEWINDPRTGEGPVRGLDNVIQFLRDQEAMFAEVRFEPERFFEADSAVVVFVHGTGEGRASGAPFDIRIAHLWTLQDGIVVRGRGFGDRDEALDAAGIQP